MKWPWHRKDNRAVQTPISAADAGDAPSEDLARARAALSASREALSRARRQRPQVAAAGRAAEVTMSRNHLAELVRSALGSGP